MTVNEEQEQLSDFHREFMERFILRSEARSNAFLDRLNIELEELKAERELAKWVRDKGFKSRGLLDATMPLEGV